MAGNFRTQNGIITAKVETTAGTDATPTTASNAVQFQNGWSLTPDFESLDTNLNRSTLSQSAPIVGRGMGRFQGGALLEGCATAGTAPGLSPLYQACGLGETLTASDVTGTAQAGGASTITLAATGSSSVNDAYVGMVIATTGGTGSGQVAVITDYVESTKVATVSPAWAVEPDATTTYTIYANALYQPASVGLESISLYGYDNHSDGSSDSVLAKLLGAMGTFTLEAPTGQLPQLNFTMMGQYVQPADVSAPSALAYQASRAYPVMGHGAWLGGSAIAMSSLSLDVGMDVQAFDDPSEAFGYDVFQAVGRNVTGSFVADRALVATRDVVNDFLDSTSRSLWLRWGGSAAGTRFSLYLPALRYTGADVGDLRGFRTEEVQFRATGDDTEFYLCIY